MIPGSGIYAEKRYPDKGKFRMGLYGSAPPADHPTSSTFHCPPHKILIVHLVKDRVAYRAPSLSSAEASSPSADRAVLFCDTGVVCFLLRQRRKNILKFRTSVEENRAPYNQRGAKIFCHGVQSISQEHTSNKTGSCQNVSLRLGSN